MSISPSSSPSSSSQFSHSQNSHSQRSSILLVDDTPENLRLLAKILELEGYRVRCTISGRLALQAAQREPPDLILLDIMMPEMDGYEVCKALKAVPITHDIPVIFISALERTSDKIRAFELGGVDYITKPFQEQEVLARIRSQLTIQQQRQQLQEQNYQLEVALQQAQLYHIAQAQVEELERLNRLKDDFLNTISHELRTPISSIDQARQMLERLLQQAGMLDTSSSIAQCLQVLHHECKREMTLIHNLLDLSRMDAGTEPLTPTPIDLHVWIPHIAESFEERIHQQQQHLKLCLSPSLPIVHTDVVDLEQILTELLTNACKYTPADGTITISVTPTCKSVQIAVCNSGVEISSADGDRIFDKFYRIPNSDPWRHEGLGVGLALVKKRIARLGGTIKVHSANQQTTFTLHLPIERDHESPSPEDS